LRRRHTRDVRPIDRRSSKIVATTLRESQEEELLCWMPGSTFSNMAHQCPVAARELHLAVNGWKREGLQTEEKPTNRTRGTKESRHTVARVRDRTGSKATDGAARCKRLQHGPKTCQTNAAKRTRKPRFTDALPRHSLTASAIASSTTNGCLKMIRCGQRLKNQTSRAETSCPAHIALASVGRNAIAFNTWTQADGCM
jgi:hypothetical protein